MCVLILSKTLQYFSFYETFTDIWSEMYIGLRVKYPLFLSDCNEPWSFTTEFLKILKYEISWKSVQWEPRCSVRWDGQTDRNNEANSRAFYSFANAPKKEYLCFDSRKCMILQVDVTWLHEFY